MLTLYRVAAVLAVSLVLSLAVSIFIDVNHMRFMMGNCPGECPSVFPTPLFFVSFILSFSLITAVGLIIAGSLASARGPSASEPASPNSNGDALSDLSMARKLLPRLERRVLDYIVENGGEVSQASIARDLGLSKVRTWRIVQRLEKKGLVEVYKVKGRNMVRIRRS